MTTEPIKLLESNNHWTVLNNFIYCSDGLGVGYLIITVGSGSRAFANENCSPGLAFDHFSQMPGVCPGGMRAAGIGSHMKQIIYLHENVPAL